MENVVEQHVFVVDDDPAILRAIAETLGSIGVETTCFLRASICLKQLQSQKCDLLITNLKMSEINGIELLRQAKESVPWLPVLIVTGYGSIKDAVAAIKSGAVDFVEKPISKEGFLQKIQGILQQNASSIAYVRALLTDPETELLKLIWAGKTNEEMATLLNCTQRTIGIRRRTIMKKCGVKNIVGFFKRCASMGLIDLPPKRTKTNVVRHHVLILG